MKKKFLYSSLLIASVGMLFAAAAPAAITKVSAEPVASTMFNAIGDSVSVLEEDGVTSCDLNGWGTGFSSKEKLYLDGLSFDFYFDGIGLNGLGFTFDPVMNSTDLNANFHAPTVCFWDRGPIFGASGQLGLFLNDNHDYNSGSTKIRVSPESQSDAFGYDKCIVATQSAVQNGVHVEYLKESAEWWSIKFTALEGMQKFSDYGNNPNLSGESVKVFISQANFAAAMDETGASYLRVFDVNSGTNVYIKNLQNGDPYAKINFTTMNGDPTREKATRIENGYSIDGVSCGALVSEKMLYLNGLEFDFSLQPRSQNGNYAVGLSFVQDKTYVGSDSSATTNGTTLCLNRNAGGSNQDRFTLLDKQLDFEWSNYPAINYKSMDDATPSGFSGAGGLVANYGDTLPTEGHFKFEKLNADWWKLSINTRDQYIWGDPNYNAENNNYAFTYIKNSDLSIDTNGGAYLAIQFRNGDGSLATAKLTKVVNGSKIIGIVHPESVSLDKETLSVDAQDSGKLVAAVLPADATNKAVIWSSSNTDVATVKDGVVTGVAAGTATITATTVDGGLEDSCEVSVLALETEPKWKIANGDPAREIGYKSSSTGAHKVQVGGPGADLYYEDQFTLDGFEFDFGNMYQNATTDSAFYFSTSKDHSDSKLTFTLEHMYRNGTSQTRLGINKGAYNDASSFAYTSKNLDGQKGMSAAVTLVFNSLKENETVHIKFEREEFNWWKVTISETAANKGTFMWGDPNFNWSEDPTGLKSAYFYIYNDDLDLDAETKGYLHVRNESSTTVVMTAANIVNGSYNPIEEPAATPAQVKAIKDKIAAISFLEYDEKQAETFENLVGIALLACDKENIKFSELNAIYSNLVSEIRNTHLELSFSAKDITYGEDTDPTANWVDVWAHGVKANRLNNDGGVMIGAISTYGMRGKFGTSYDISNIEIKIDLSAMQSGTVGALAFSTVEGNECAYVSPDSGKIFSFDFYKFAEGQYTITLSGATQDHNLSVEGFSNGTTYHPAYNGRNVDVFSNIITVSIETNFNTSKSVVSLNGDQVELDAALLFGEAPTAKVDGYVALGVFNGDGSVNNVRVEYVKDAKSIEVAQEVKNALVTMEEIANTLSSSISGPLTDTTYGAYKAAFDLAKQELIAEVIEQPANENLYLSLCANAYIAELEEPITVYQAALALAKSNAVTELVGYFKEELYDNEGYDQCQEAIRNATTQINAATSLTEVSVRLAAGKAAIDSVMKKDVKEAITNGVNEITTFIQGLDASKYTEENQAIITAIGVKAISDIKACTTVSQVAPIVEKAKADINAVEQKKGGCGGVIATSTVVVGILALAGIGFISYKKKKED